MNHNDDKDYNDYNHDNDEDLINIYFLMDDDTLIYNLVDELHVQYVILHVGLIPISIQIIDDHYVFYDFLFLLNMYYL